MPVADPAADRYSAITDSNVDRLPQWAALDPALREGVRVVSAVLPFRTNAYVCRELIDWRRVPDDPMFRLTFPHREMLDPEDYSRMARLVLGGADPADIRATANTIRMQLNPHPAGQMSDNVPTFHGQRLAGVQHKYRETVLFFPRQGQTCHAYCTFCFRWPQFVGMEELKFAGNEVATLVDYVSTQRRVSDVLFTGGDPLIMSTRALREYLLALLDPRLEHVQTIRLGTKAVAYWPQRFVSDPDADDLLRLLETVANAGKHLAVMGHYSHPIELSTSVAQQAVRRLRSAGVTIRMQSPIIRHVNDDARIWAELWRSGVRLGCVPYYMFVERDTGARRYFELPLARCWEIYRDAYSRVSGVARTVRGPSMSAHPGKVHIIGVSELENQRVFVLQYIQARNPSLVRRPFFAKFDAGACWFDDLRPARRADEPFFPIASPRLIRLNLPHRSPAAGRKSRPPHADT